jgi:Lon-like protease
MKKSLYLRSFLIGAIIALALTFIQLPYYVTKPGIAKELSPIIKVEGGDKEEGSFYLTTVRMGQANIISYLLAHISPHQMIYPMEQILQKGETEEEYTYRQLHMMEGSQEAAITVAYKHANKKIEFKYHGVYVMNVLPNMPAAKVLKPGDRLFRVDGKSMQTSEEFIEYISKKKEGDKITLTFERNGKEKSTLIRLQKFPDDPDKIGIGITLVTDREVITTPKVTIDTNDIGGPSAGLMFSLEIYNQLVKGDLTKGYKIAGTGTINDKGEVGRIGGISQKIVAADKAGVDIFFAPNEGGSSDSNYREAVKTAKEIGTKMKIVPVDTFEDAVNYLQKLEPKK